MTRPSPGGTRSWPTARSAPRAGRAGATVVDLLSAEYAAAVPAAARRDRQWVTVDFVDAAGTRVPGTIGKQCKGALARRLLVAGEATAAAAVADGMRLLEDAEDTWVLQV